MAKDYDPIAQLEAIERGEYQDANTAIKTLARCVLDLEKKVQTIAEHPIIVMNVDDRPPSDPV